MKNILIHGLGQTEKSWNIAKQYLKEFDVETPNLFQQYNLSEMSYSNLEHAFVNHCNSSFEKLNLCGLSLGGILALEYAKKYPDQVNSLILIGTPDRIPKVLFHIQNFVFQLMPKKSFEKLGITKREFCQLVHSMYHIKISENLENVKCNCLILCGSKDYSNLKSAKRLSDGIPNSTMKVVAKSSHEVNINQPKELAHLISQFWKENER